MIAPKEELFSKLVEKTKQLGRQVTFAEMAQDLGAYRTNDFAIYYGSFTEASTIAYRQFCRDTGVELKTNELKKKIEF